MKGSSNHKKWIGGLSLQAVLLIILTVVYLSFFDQIPSKSAAGILCEILCMIISFLLSFSILQNKMKEEGRNLLLLIIINTIYLFSNSLFFCVNKIKKLGVLNSLNNIVYLICPLVLTMVFWDLLDLWLGPYEKNKKYSKWPLLTIASIQILLILGNIPGGYYFSIDPSTGTYSRGRLYLLTEIIPLLLLIICFKRIVSCKITLREKLIILSYPVLPCIASIVQIRGVRYDFISICVFLSIIFIYTNFFVNKELVLSQLELNLEKTRMRSLQMQIKPHFLYNTLTSIAGLCEDEPAAAQEMIYRLSDYLRDNFTDIEKPMMVTFREEVEQLSHYIAIEQMRFPNIEIEWDLAVSDFLIPGITLQPLVENAINHGIRKRRKSQGIIRISSSETGEEFHVNVKDNGMGFDPDRLPDATEKHFGLSNVASRLEMLCGGRLEIKSTVGEGAEVVVIIPKNRGRVQAFSQQL